VQILTISSNISSNHPEKWGTIDQALQALGLMFYLATQTKTEVCLGCGRLEWKPWTWLDNPGKLYEHIYLNISWFVTRRKIGFMDTAYISIVNGGYEATNITWRHHRDI